MSWFCTEYRMARSGRLAPLSSAAFTALWQVSFRSWGAGCHSGGPYKPPHALAFLVSRCLRR